MPASRELTSSGSKDLASKSEESGNSGEQGANRHTSQKQPRVLFSPSSYNASNEGYDPNVLDGLLPRVETRGSSMCRRWKHKVGSDKKGA